jgi:hypothetical protein
VCPKSFSDAPGATAREWKVRQFVDYTLCGYFVKASGNAVYSGAFLEKMYRMRKRFDWCQRSKQPSPRLAGLRLPRRLP